MDAHEERGYFHLLLAQASEETCTLPDDDHQLAIISMLGPQWSKPTKDKSRRIGTKTSGQKLREQFIVRPLASPGRIYNERLYREWLYQKGVVERRRSNGALGGRPKKPEVIAEKPNGYQEETERFAENNLEKTNIVSVSVSSLVVTKKPSLLDDFENFKLAAIGASLPFSDPDIRLAKFEWGVLDFQQKLLATNGLIERKQCGEYDDARFRPLPQNYLKQRMWERQIRTNPKISPGSKHDPAFAPVPKFEGFKPPND